MQIQSVETSAGTEICAAPLKNGIMQPVALFQVALDIFDRHRRIVHQDADRKRQSAQCHDVDRLSPAGRNDDRGKDRQWNRDCDDDGAAPTSQEEGSSDQSAQQRSLPHG